MNSCTYQYKDFEKNCISECTFYEDDHNEIGWFFETDGQPSSIVSAKINGEDVSLDEARYVLYIWENKILLNNHDIDEVTYENNIRLTTEKMKGFGVDVDKWKEFCYNTRN